YHANPVVDATNTWVYFAHSSSSAGEPMNHAARSYAQIYRVHLDGTGLESITAEAGCHYAPVIGAANKLFFIHATCNHQRDTVVAFDTRANTQTPRLGFTDGGTNSLSLDGEWSAFSTSFGPSATVTIMSELTGKKIVIASGRTTNRIVP